MSRRSRPKGLGSNRRARHVGRWGERLPEREADEGVMFDPSLTVRPPHDIDRGRLQPGACLITTGGLEGVEQRDQMRGLQILDVQVTERAVDVADHALVAVAGFVGTRLLVDVRLPALSCLLDRLTTRLLDLGERCGELL